MASISKNFTSKGEPRFRVRVNVNGQRISKTFIMKWQAIDWARMMEVQGFMERYYGPSRQ